MKKIKIALRTLGFAGLSAALFSCSSTPEHAKYIPDNSLMVAALNLENMVLKAEPEMVMEMDMFKEILRDIKNDANKDQRKLLDEFLDNPIVAGVDFLEPVYYFMNSSDEEEYQYMCISMYLSNESNFEECIVTLTKDEMDVEEAEGYRYVDNEEVAIGWGNHSALVVVSMNRETGAGEYLEDIFGIKEDESFINTNSDFADFVAGEYDMGLYANWSTGVIWYQSLFDMFSGFGGDYVDDYMDDFMTDLSDYENNFSEVQVTFNDNEINAEIKNHFNEVMAERFDLGGTGVPASYMTSLTDDELVGAFSASMDVGRYVEVMTNLPGYDGMADEIYDELGIDVDELSDVFTGNMVVSLVGVKMVEREDYYGSMYDYEALSEMDFNDLDEMLGMLEGAGEPRMVEEPMPVFVATVGVDDTDILEDLLEDKMDKDGNIYNMGGDVFVTFYDDRMFMTNDGDYADELADRGSLGNYNNSDVTRLFTDHAIAGYMNLDMGSYDKETRALLEEEMGMFIFPMVDEYSQELIDARFYGSYTETAFELNFKEGKHNTLYRILEAAGGE